MRRLAERKHAAPYRKRGRRRVLALNRPPPPAGSGIQILISLVTDVVAL